MSFNIEAILHSSISVDKRNEFPGPNQHFATMQQEQNSINNFLTNFILQSIRSGSNSSMPATCVDGMLQEYAKCLFKPHHKIQPPTCLPQMPIYMSIQHGNAECKSAIDSEFALASSR
ncbi:hypothetical protein Ciccas_000406 [Cichlidogyrus casuarinus]|uniref:Uncharacterized protein n=1 Tax=Cichlidogyrus casuarinus TaxID=1844966 RepID=A0ABD2QQC4_9PLAT